MNFFPESDEKDNGYETAEEQLKDTYAYSKVCCLVLVFVLLSVAVFLI